jgi:uncharacterized protein YyaL (SSP411 family)
MLADCRAKVRAMRDKRPRPHLDDKVIVAWNGLMISAFARAYQVLRDETYLAVLSLSLSFYQLNL